MNNGLFLNVSEWSFFVLVFIYFYCCLFLLFFCFSVLYLLFFNNKNNSFFGLRYVPLVIKAKRNAIGLFQCSLAENGTMFILSYFYT